MFVGSFKSHAKNITFSVKCSVFSLFSSRKFICEVCDLYGNQNRNETTFAVANNFDTVLAHKRSILRRDHKRPVLEWSLHNKFYITNSD